MKVLFLITLSDAVSDFSPAVSSFPPSWLKYFPFWLAWKLGTALKTGHTAFKNIKRVSNRYGPFQTHTQSNSHSLFFSLLPNSCPTLQSAAVWTDTHLAKVNMVFSSYTHTDTIMGNPMVGQTSLTLVKAKTHVLMSIDFPLFHPPVLLKCCLKHMPVDHRSNWYFVFYHMCKGSMSFESYSLATNSV